MYTPIIKSFFSGAGGLDGGLTEAGCSVIESLEIDKVACETLRKNFTHKVNEKDITKETVLDKADCDGMVFTFPCTKYSTIADIHQTRTGDELFLHAMRHVALARPSLYVVENVKGMRRFKVVMECFAKMPDYHVKIFCPLNASLWLPQDRERLIIIATKKHFAINEPAPLVNRPTLKSILEKDVQIEVTESVIDRLDGKYRDLPIVSDPENKYALAPTCVAHYSKDKGTRLVKDKSYPRGVRPYTVREYARLQGFPDWFQFAGTDNQAYKQIGNAVPWQMGQWIGEQAIKYFNQSSQSLPIAA